MKKWLSLLVGSCFLPVGLAWGGVADCGLGSQIFKDKSVLSQTVAYTTNGTSHISSVTTGTSGCDFQGIVEQERLGEIYISQTYLNLEEEAARGEGPYVNGLAQIMGCSAEAQTVFGTMLRQNYEQLFAEKTTAESARQQALLQGVKAQIRTHAVLAAQCKIS